MRYVLQVYFHGAQERLAMLPDAERDAVIADYRTFFSAPEIRDGNQLQAPATAITVRLSDGEIMSTTGPGSDGEPLGGYYLVEVDGPDAAIALAARIPAVRMGGAIEVRPVIDQ